MICQNPNCPRPNIDLTGNIYCIYCGTKLPPAKRKTDDNSGFIEQINPRIGLQMQFIPGGRYWMGSSVNDIGEDNEKPQHFVVIERFYISTYLTTQLQYEKILGRNPSLHQSYSAPVEMVSYFDALDFCDRLTAKSGRRYRLPTESEWEYACRGNTTSLYSFGDEIGQKACHFTSSQLPTAVGLYNPNSFGLYDMHGNVWEWCQDYWHPSYENAPKIQKAWLVDGDYKSRVIRGGSWLDNESSCRSASRDFLDPKKAYNNVGFRVVCDY